MITDANLPTARRLLASFNDAMQYKLAHHPKPMRDWLREAKPLAGLDLSSRPLPSLVYYMIKVDTEKAEAAMSGARSMMASAPDTRPAPVAEITEADITSTLVKILDDTLPTPPDVITVHIRAGRANEIAAATSDANKTAWKDTLPALVAALREHEASVRDKVMRHAAFVGVDDEAVRLLVLAARLDQAADLIETHAIHDEDNG